MSASMSFTCISCRVSFPSAELQREHHRTDWHRYNLKRKVVGMAPVTAEGFQQRLEHQQEKTVLEKQAEEYSGQCKACNKVYSTENQYNNHMASKKHKEMAAKYQARLESGEITASKPKKEEAEVDGEAMDEDDVEEVENFELGETDCLFCPHQSKDFESNMAHMTKKHSFYIPDHEFLVDLTGFVLYLGKKVCEGFMCLYCNEKGRAFMSMEAAQKHMVDKGHCMIAYEDKDMDEYEDFYDFSSTYPDFDPNNPDQKNAEVDIEGLSVSEDGTELVLPNGRHIVHRDMARYYKQNFRPEDMRVSVQVNKTQVPRELYQKAIGYGRSVGPITKKEKYDEMRRVANQSRWYVALGTKKFTTANMHFRDPNGFLQ
eukprot:comp10563_c0_seq1/m.5270 comp10563_c0_seq1/g.5270  ORF comp10563_c0_seq1/g.5270 comp10563_c0_seq1/m.5270 type:complete len:373 (-) comp10563_c0_seq1:344-1462(-)